MKILFIHNAYTEFGGEDAIFRREQAMLTQAGCQVRTCVRSNSEIAALTPVGKWRLFWKDALWNSAAYNDVKAIVREFRPDIVHIHNPFYLMSPSVYEACFEEGVPVVQSLHNYRWLLDRADGREFPEFDIPPSRPVKWLLRHALLPRILRSYARQKIFEKIDTFIVLSSFCKEQYVKYGVPAGKIRILPPSFAIDAAPLLKKENHALFVGRLVDYKGAGLLLDVCRRYPDLAVRFIGEGPLENEIRRVAEHYPNIKYLGRLPSESVMAEMRKAACLVAPSYCYETFGVAIVEAFGCGIPVIGSNHGTMAELIEEGKTGLLFSVGNAQELAGKLRQLLNQPALSSAMGENARIFFEENFAAGREEQPKLVGLYQELINAKKVTS